jgi:hypothetical protein
VLKWARENGCPWDEDTCAGAAECGHLEVLKWARTNGCPWDGRTCVHAAEGGHLEMRSGRAITTARGTRTRARARRSAATSRC